MCIDAWTNIIILSVYSTIHIVVAQSIYGLDQYYLHRRVQGRRVSWHYSRVYYGS